MGGASQVVVESKVHMPLVELEHDSLQLCFVSVAAYSTR